MRNSIKITQFFGFALVVLVGLIVLSPKTVFAANATCGDGTVVTVPDQNFGPEDNLLIRHNACKDNGGFGPTATAVGGACDSQKSILGIPTWYKYLATEVDSTGKCSPVLSGVSGSNTEGKVNSVLPIGLAVLEMLLRISGLVAVVMVFIGGFKFITSQGNPENAKGAQKTVINALIGMSIVIISTAVVNVIGNRLV